MVSALAHANARLTSGKSPRQQAAVALAKIRGIEGQAAYVTDRSQLLLDRRWRRKAILELPIAGEAQRQDAARHAAKGQFRSELD